MWALKWTRLCILYARIVAGPPVLREQQAIRIGARLL